jgi:hypothetical protein
MGMARIATSRALRRRVAEEKAERRASNRGRLTLAATPSQ